MDATLKTATPESLEDLEAKILQQITHVKNERVKRHLEMMLQDIQQRKEIVRQQSQSQSDETTSDDSDVFMLSDEIENEGVLLNAVLENANREAARETSAPTEQEHVMVKERMKAMLTLSQKQTQTFTVQRESEERMHFPKIPEIATKEYLEQLENALAQQLEKTKNDKVRGHLKLLLEEIQRRKLAFTTTEQVAQAENAASQPDALPRAGNLFDTPQVLEEKSQTQETAEPHEAMLKIPETATEDYLEKLEERTADQLKKVTNEQAKIRLETLLQEIRRWKSSYSENIAPEPEAQEHEFLFQEEHSEKNIFEELAALEPLQEIEPFSPIVSGEIGRQNITPETVTDKHLELLEVKVAQRLQNTKNERVKSLLTKLLQKIHHQREVLKQTFQEEITESAELSFAEVCLKVMDGETLGLFDHVELSEREQELITAFLGHLSSVQGIKKQKVYEMQYMAGRSIVEFERIFKTYNAQLQGPVYSELSKIFNRLVFLRNQFSLLMR